MIEFIFDPDEDSALSVAQELLEQVQDDFREKDLKIDIDTETAEKKIAETIREAVASYSEGGLGAAPQRAPSSHGSERGDAQETLHEVSPERRQVSVADAATFGQMRGQDAPAALGDSQLPPSTSMSSFPPLPLNGASPAVPARISGTGSSPAAAVATRPAEDPAALSAQEGPAIESAVAPPQELSRDTAPASAPAAWNPAGSPVGAGKDYKSAVMRPVPAAAAPVDDAAAANPAGEAAPSLPSEPRADGPTAATAQAAPAPQLAAHAPGMSVGSNPISEGVSMAAISPQAPPVAAASASALPAAAPQATPPAEPAAAPAATPVVAAAAAPAAAPAAMPVAAAPGLQALPALPAAPAAPAVAVAPAASAARAAPAASAASATPAPLAAPLAPAAPPATSLATAPPASAPADAAQELEKVENELHGVAAQITELEQVPRPFCEPAAHLALVSQPPGHTRMMLKLCVFSRCRKRKTSKRKGENSKQRRSAFVSSKAAFREHRQRCRR